MAKDSSNLVVGKRFKWNLCLGVLPFLLKLRRSHHSFVYFAWHFRPVVVFSHGVIHTILSRESVEREMT